MERRLPRSPVLKSPVLSPKSPAIYEKYKSGCAWGLIHFFDFRQGHSHGKLISDKKRVHRHAKGDNDTKNRPKSLSNVKYQYPDDGLDNKDVAVNSRKAEIKKVTEEEMIVKHQTIKNTDDRQNLQLSHSKDHRKASKNTKKSSRIPAHDGSTEGYRQAPNQNMVDRSSNSNELQTNNAGNYKGKSIRGRKHEHGTEINVGAHMKEAVEAFVNRKLTDGENLSSNEVANRSKNFIDALEILNSNKELFMKLLQDPNSLLVKHIQGLRDSQEMKQQSQSSSKAQKTQESEPLNTIVLLKPGMQNCPDRKHRSAKSAFLSFEHMKRKLRHAIRVNKKDQCQMSIEGSDNSQRDLEEFEDGGKEMSRLANERIPAGNNHLNVGKMPESSHAVNRRDRMDRREYFQSRKHISEMLYRGNEDFSRTQTLRTLDRLMSFPQQDFLPRLTSGRDKGHEFGSPQMRFSPYVSFSTDNLYEWRVQKEKKSACLSSSAIRSLEGAKTSISSNLPPATKVLQNVYSLGDDLSQKVDQTSVCPGKVMESNEASGRNTLEPNIVQNTNDNLGTESVNIYEEKGYLECSKLDSTLGDQTSTSSMDVYSSSPSHIQRIEDSDSMTDGAEQPSPISVLEHFFVEDNTSSPSTVSLAAETPVESSCLDMEEHYASSIMESHFVQKSNEEYTSNDKQGSLAQYIRAILQISGLNWGELSRCHFSDQMLDSSSLFDNVQVWPDKPSTDRKLLFGYISEVLLEIYECYFRCSPWVLLLKPSPQPVLSSKNAVQEVLRRIDWLLLSELPQQALQQLVEKDLAKSGVWIDTRVDTEEVVTELVDNILQDLIVEAAI
ncbi:hypothetical protein CCACVL1_13600 [Corchorus capsularis]|uniref:DUF4378 domain-containing protein n=1 Tax=Corchorus capsularis TaxID=210143 RepID=A0A1R3IAF7_COCAP|nr:hypothetical protein CCACVL1_13600 [Corchorus capsularis]